MVLPANAEQDTTVREKYDNCVVLIVTKDGKRRFGLEKDGRVILPATYVMWYHSETHTAVFRQKDGNKYRLLMVNTLSGKIGYDIVLSVNENGNIPRIIFEEKDDCYEAILLYGIGEWVKPTVISRFYK